MSLYPTYIEILFWLCSFLSDSFHSTWHTLNLSILQQIASFSLFRWLSCFLLLYMYHSCFIQKYVCGHLCCTHTFAIVFSNAVNKEYIGFFSDFWLGVLISSFIGALDFEFTRIWRWGTGDLFTLPFSVITYVQQPVERIDF